ncbi:MAG: PhoU domain-containing protein [Candidatus Bathyarchaeia archaeon]
MEFRKVQEMGGGTILVSLPKSWGRRYGVSKGSLVALQERRDGCLLVDPHTAEGVPETAVIRYPFMGIEYIEWGLTGAYLLGYDFIHVKAEREERIDPVDLEKIKDMIQNLIGLEIMEESSDMVKAQCIIDPSLLDPDSLIQRMKVITESMAMDVRKALTEGDRGLVRGVVSRDDEVDRIYFFLVRLLRNAVQHPKIAEGFSITPLDCLDYRLVASLLESIADHTASIAHETGSHPDQNLDEETKVYIAQAFDTLIEMLESAIQGFLSQRIKTLQELRKRYKELTGVLDKLTGEKPSPKPHKSPVIPSISSYIKDIGRNCIDICDLIPPTQILQVSKEAQ